MLLDGRRGAGPLGSPDSIGGPIGRVGGDGTHSKVIEKPGVQSMTTTERVEKIRKMVREAIAHALLAEAQGEENLLKEVWESCRDGQEIEVVVEETVSIAKGLLGTR